LLAESWTPRNDTERDADLDTTFIDVEYKFKDLPVEELDAEAKKILRKAGVEQRFHWPLEFPEVFDKGGFDAVVGNPPYQGGTVASTSLGVEYTQFIANQFVPWHGKADLVGAFIRQSSRVLKRSGFVGVVTTASLVRGETLASSLVPLVTKGAIVCRGRSPFSWPGAAKVTAVCIWLGLGEWNGPKVLDSVDVESIGPDLEPMVLENPQALSQCHAGYLGIKLSPNNITVSLAVFDTLPDVCKDALLPVIGGKELYRNIHWDSGPFAFEPNRVSEDVAKNWADAMDSDLTLKNLKHSAPASKLRQLLRKSELAFACAETTHVQLAFVRVPTNGVLLKHTTIVFPNCKWGTFLVLQSHIHTLWAWKYGIRRKLDLRYSPKRCSHTFPFPTLHSNGDSLGKQYHDIREESMCQYSEGLTSLYNRFHHPDEASTQIENLRILHIEMDRAVAAAYGWDDLDFGHDFQETKQGVRFTISEEARREVLQRLLKLNHERYEEEVRQGLHDKKGKKKSRKKASKKSKSKQSNSSHPTFPGMDG